MEHALDVSEAFEKVDSEFPSSREADKGSENPRPFKVRPDSS